MHALGLLVGLVAMSGGHHQGPTFHLQLNERGISESIRTDGGPIVDPSNPFFQSLGTNGRSCSTCHTPEDNFTITPEHLQARFNRTRGQDPVFRSNDGTNSPEADQSTLAARRRASSMLLSRGTIRIGIGMPPVADFDLVGIHDPYGHASAQELSLFRRPLPATNLDIVTVMQDGRETFPGQTLGFNLAHQAMDATLGHAQATHSPTQAQLDAIVDYETHLFTAQVFTFSAGPLMVDGAQGGPVPLSQQDYYPGINDLFGDSQTGAPFNPLAMTVFDAWPTQAHHWLDEGRASVARGEALFNTRTLHIEGVAGINDNPAFGSPAVVNGTCSTCHDAPNVGNHSVGLALNLGIADAHPVGNLDTQGLPVYTFRSKATGELKVLTDPGVGLLNGKFADLGKFKGPTLRGLSGRAPYFHNGSAHSLQDVVNFYDARFTMHLTRSEEADLVAFLSSL
jgi:hypothetical protein